MFDMTDPTDLGALLARNVRALREQRGLSQTQLAQRMNEHGLRWLQNTIQRVEHQQRRVDIAEAHALARALGVTVDALLADSHEHSPAADASIDQLRAAYEECEEAAAELANAQQRQLSADRQLALLFPAGLSVGEARAAAKAALATEKPGG
ncbi:MAG: XRE family transcriptional regulator [Mycobacterium sp.]|nr:MAG: XRE family transcriptional regulator [Mycobacterium sp.]